MPGLGLEHLGTYADTLRFSVHKNIGIGVWRGQADGAAVSFLTHTVEDLLEARDLKFSWVHIVANRVPLPDAAGREGLIQLMKDHESRTACAAIVIHGSGFWAGAMRAAVTGLRILVPRSFDYRLHGAVDEVVGWLPSVHHSRTGIAIPPSELAYALHNAEAWLSLEG